MSMRGLHAAMGALRRLQHEAATGVCAICQRPSVGYIQGIDNIPRGVCAPHKEQGERRGYTVWPDPEEEKENP